MAAPKLIPQGGGAFVGSIPRAPDPTPPEINIIYKERMPAPDSILQGGGTFVGSIPRAPNPAPPKNEYCLQEHKERMPVPNLIPQKAGAFLGPIHQDRDPALLKFLLFTGARIYRAESTALGLE
jgi:hypothetical protein